MKHFLQIGSLETGPLIQALVLNEGLWNDGEIILRQDEWGAAWKELPQAREMVLNVLRGSEGAGLFDVTIKRWGPGVTETKAPARVVRYEIVVYALPGVSLAVGEEEIPLSMGSIWVWQLEADEVLERRNRSADDTFSIILEIDL